MTGQPVVETVHGAIAARELGRTLVHEHLRSSSEAVRVQFPHLYDVTTEFHRALEEVRGAMRHGVHTIVDPACMGLGRDAPFAQRVAAETGINLVLATGAYGEHYTFLPHHFQNHDVDYLADAFVHDIEIGIQGTAVKAAFIKTAMDKPGLTPDVEKIHRAAARASVRTERPIMAHSRPKSQTGLEQLRIFEEEGVEPHRILIAHAGDTDNLDHIEDLLSHGVWIGMDRYGTGAYVSDDDRDDVVSTLCARGFSGRMMLSHDACATVDWFPEGTVEEARQFWNFSGIFDHVIPRLTKSGVTEDQIHTMLDRNPASWLSGVSNGVC